MPNITESILYPDIADILKDGQQHTTTYSAILHTDTIDLDVHTLVSIDIVRKYHEAMGDTIYAKVYIPLGDFIFAMYSNTVGRVEGSKFKITDNVEMTLITLSQHAGVSHVRYKATIPPQVFDGLQPEFLMQNGLNELNRSGMHIIDVQLVPLLTEPLLLAKVRGVANEYTRKMLLETWLKGSTDEISVVGGGLIDKVIVTDPENTEPTNQLVIPTGTRTVDLPAYIQKHGGGLYAGHIGSYVQSVDGKNNWYVYPLYWGNPYKDSDEKLRIFILDERYVTDHDVTYLYKDKVLSIIAGESSGSTAAAEGISAKAPKGFTLDDGDNIIGDTIAIKGGKLTANPERIRKNVFFQNSADQMNPTLDLKERRTTNYYVAASHTTAVSGERVDVIWQGGHPGLLFPGMGVRCYRDVDGQVLEQDGILHFNHTLISTATEGLGENTFQRVTMLSIFIPGEQI